MFSILIVGCRHGTAVSRLGACIRTWQNVYLTYVHFLGHSVYLSSTKEDNKKKKLYNAK